MSTPRGLTKPHHYLELAPVVLIELALIYAAASAFAHLFRMGLL